MPDPNETPLAVKVTIDGKVHEFSAEAMELPEGHRLVSDEKLREEYIPKRTHDAQLNGLKRAQQKELERLQGERFTADELLSEEGEERLTEFLDHPGARDRLAKVLGVRNGGPNEQDIERIREKVRKTEVKPLEEKLGEIQTLSTRLIQQGLRGAVEAACSELGVKRGSRELILEWYRTHAAYDSEHDGYFIRAANGDGFEMSDDPKQGPYQTIVAHLAERKANAWAEHFEPKTRPGAGVRDTGTGAPGQARSKADLKSDKDRSDFISQHGLPAFEALPLK